eukprot:1018288-Prorocentrum_lima.AAC.1
MGEAELSGAMRSTRATALSKQTPLVALSTTQWRYAQHSGNGTKQPLSLIHISEPTRLDVI